jgi:Rhodopirellula transposase DDE domain
LFLTADAGDSNGYRLRAGKAELAGLAAKTGMRITVCHHLATTSKRNRIGYRMFSYITTYWRGRPLTTLGTTIELMPAATTNPGLSGQAILRMITGTLVGVLLLLVWPPQLSREKP